MTSVQQTSKLTEGEFYPGEIVLKPSGKTYFNFINCNGSLLKKSVYPNLYSAIGDDYSYQVIQGGGFPWKNQCTFNSNNNTTVSWNSYYSLPTGLYNFEAVITKNYVYLIGGNNGSVISNIYSAAIDSNGNIGGWSLVGYLPIAIQSMSCVVYKNYLYCIGGETSSTTQVTNVYRCFINSDGTLGTWIQDLNLPTPISRSKAIVTNKRIYLLGGYSGSPTRALQYTDINSDGSLNGWNIYYILPVNPSSYSAITYYNKIHILQYYVNYGNYNTLTGINNDDTFLDNWILGQSQCVNNVYNPEVVSNSNFALMLGGQDSSNNPLSSSYIATINADGTIGTWTGTTSLPTSMYGHKAVVTSSKLYILGGYNTSPLNSVYYLNYSGGMNDYSQFYSSNYIPTYLPSDSFYIPDMSNINIPIPTHSYYLKIV